jgi:hypothetical protein
MAVAPRTSASILDAAAPILTVQLLNAATTRPAANMAVTVHTDNGIECTMARCPRNDREWKGMSDADGVVRIAKDILQREALIQTPSLDGDMIEDSYLVGAGRWVVELLPRDPAGTMGPHPLKLLDARTSKPIADSPVRLDLETGDGRHRYRKFRSNALGYVFIPFDVAIATDPGHVWLEVPGYRRTPADFGWAYRKTRLQRR